MDIANVTADKAANATEETWEDEADEQPRIVVKGRNVEVPDHYRQLVREKLARLFRYDHKLSHVDVELFHEPNPRQAQACQRVELTCRSRGPVIRSEACAKDFYSALDKAVSKLDNRMRRAADRRRIHRGRRTPISVAAATARLSPDGEGSPAGVAVLEHSRLSESEGVDDEYGAVPTAREPADNYVPGRVVREKEHTAKPMTVDQALFEMELIGHDFFLFSDVDTGRASVVYRRHGYDYGVLSLAN